jgi:hypothetical protein
MRRVEGEISRTVTTSDLLMQKHHLVQTIENYVTDPATNQSTWNLQQIRATQEVLQARGYWAADAYARNQQDANQARLILVDRFGLFTVGVKPEGLTLIGKTANGAQAFASVDQQGVYTYGATGTEAQLRELGMKIDQLRKENVAGEPAREILAERGKYTVVMSDGSYTLQGKTANGATAFARLDENGKGSFGATGTEAQLNELKLKASELLDHNRADQAGTDSRQIQDAKGNYTVIESDGSYTLQGKLDDGTTQAFVTRDKDGKFSFGATGRAEKLDALGLRASELVRLNRQDQTGQDSRQIQEKEGNYTVVESGITDTLQGLLDDGKTQAFASLDAEGKYAFGATGTLEKLDALGLAATEILTKTQAGDGKQAIQPKDGKFTAVESEGAGPCRAGQPMAHRRLPRSEGTASTLTAPRVLGNNWMKSISGFRAAESQPGGSGRSDDSGR